IGIAGAGTSGVETRGNTIDSARTGSTAVAIIHDSFSAQPSAGRRSQAEGNNTERAGRPLGWAASCTPGTLIGSRTCCGNTEQYGSIIRNSAPGAPLVPEWIPRQRDLSFARTS